MTNETKHTPGPWRSTTGCIVDSRNNVVAARKSRTHLTKDTNTERGDYITPTEADANAMLIAAAPTLLDERDELREALQGLVGEMVCLFDLLNRQDPALLKKIERGELETDNNLACHFARVALAKTVSQ